MGCNKSRPSSSPGKHNVSQLMVRIGQLQTGLLMYSGSQTEMGIEDLSYNEHQATAAPLVMLPFPLRTKLSNGSRKRSTNILQPKKASNTSYHCFNMMSSETDLSRPRHRNSAINLVSGIPPIEV